MPSPEYHRLKAVEKTLQELREKEAMTPFVDSFLKGLGTVLALTPYKEWPLLAKQAFEFHSKYMPAGAQLYKSKLPKDKL
jgi:hypothetical protein